MNLMERVITYLKEKEFNFEVLRDYDTVAFGFEGESRKPWNCMFQVREVERQIMFYSNYIEDVNVKYMPNMIDYILRENYRLVVGNFELDTNDGELNYKTSIDCANINITDSILDGIMFNNLSTFDRHINNIELINSGKQPEDIEPSKTNVIKFDNVDWKKGLEGLE